MPPVKSLASKHYTYIVIIILLLNKIILLYSRYIKKRLIYITILALSSRQSFFYAKCTKLNIHLSCNI